jgi:hypothetical protein
MIRDNTKKLMDHYQHNNRWLLDKYHTGLETQIYVTPGTEEEAHPTRNDCWTDGIQTWKQVRWPYNSGTKPEFKDFEPKFALVDHVESIGTTWWAWETQESVGCVFDFDSIIGHAAGLSKKELQRIVEKLSSLDYVTIIKSTSGNGYHVLVFFEEGMRPKTKNHREHALVAEVVLNKMSEDAGFEFADKVDCYGMIGWIWSIRATEANQGFAMVKQAARDLDRTEIADWTKIPAKRMKMRPKVVAYDEEGAEVAGNNILGFTDEQIVLNKEHMRIIRALEESGFSFNPVPEHDLFHTHTAALRNVHRKLGLKGPFQTLASGKGNEKPNCFIRPVNGGGFSVFRFGKGTPEHLLWDQTTPTTWCSFNQAMPAHKVLMRMGAEWVAEQKQYEFETKEELVAATDALGNRVPLKLLDNKHYALAINGRGCVVKCFCETTDQPGECDGWQRVKGHHKKVLSRLEEVDVDSILNHVDSVVRYVVRDGEELGWAHKTEAGWIKCKETTAKRTARFHVGGQEAEMYLGAATTNPWTLVNQPFEREHLPGRQWNLESAQLIVPCATEPGPHPHWDIILNHIGQSWDDPLAQDNEMQKYGITKGSHYIMAWLACMIRHPEDPLPYIFLVGPQNSGKSVIHEVLRECIANGVVHGGNALSSGSGFNGEFEGKTLAAIDETDLSQFPGFAARLKSWTNATYIQIHKKGCQPYDVRNFMHFIQTANSVTALVIEHGDTRIVIGEVPRFEGTEIPKPVLIRKCLEELPAFLYTLGTMQLPPMAGRTRLPVITTAIKSEILESTEPDSLTFLKGMYHDIPGQYEKISDVYAEYKKWCAANNAKPTTPNDFKLQVGLKYPVHKGPSGRAYTVGNISLNENAEPQQPFTLEGKGGRHERCTS